MPRKRVTQKYPFLIPLRKWQRKRLFYLKMAFDKNRYSKHRFEDLLPHTIFETKSLLLNENSGFDMKYQHNKVHNLRLAASTIDRIVIAPNETFSFWQLVRNADRHERYLDGLTLVNGKIIGSYGGGLCQLSNMLFWMFLHSPLTVIERHGHAVESFPSTTDALPCGTDATINEGWLDLKVRNETSQTFQIGIHFDNAYMYGQLLSNEPSAIEYRLYNSAVYYFRKTEKIYQQATVCRAELNKQSRVKTEKELYVNRCEIGYPLPNNISIEERGI